MFQDRRTAGKRLAARLSHLQGSDAVVLGLPRGGVPVAAEIARHLGLPLDVVLVRKLGLPDQPELAMGAIGESGVRVLNDEVISLTGVGPEEIARVEQQERGVLEQRAKRYRDHRPRVSLEGRTVVLVDDGIATGSTVKAAVEVVRQLGARKVIVATPVAPPGSGERLASGVDEFVAVEQPPGFFAIGQFYEDFTQVSDAEVSEILEKAG